MSYLKRYLKPKTNELRKNKRLNRYNTMKKKERKKEQPNLCSVDGEDGGNHVELRASLGTVGTVRVGTVGATGGGTPSWTRLSAGMKKRELVTIG